MKKAIYCIIITALLFSSGVTLVVLNCVTDKLYLQAWEGVLL